MRYFYLLFLIIIPNHVFCQNKGYQESPVSVISPNRDTLWLMNDATGMLILQSWENPSILEKKPVIIITAVLPNHKNKIIIDNKKK